MKFIGELKGLEVGLEAVRKMIRLPEGEVVEIGLLEEASPYCIQVTKGATNSIKYRNKHHFFRAVGLYAQFVHEGVDTFDHTEKTYIKRCGSMVDVSRNSMYRVSRLKEILTNYALMGHNTFMLYTEDTYEVPEYPYFGYLRGRYTQAELRELDNFADDLGIEMIPCIQTLAHLAQTLKWNYAEEMKDSNDVLLVGAPQTYVFIEAMIRSLKSCFRSKRIHIGMDEAFSLGRGKSIDLNGYRHHLDLMMEHLDVVCDLLKKHDLEPMMWDDMFFRAMSPTGNYYDLEMGISDKVTERVPSHIGLVYWDYYHITKDYYEKAFKVREVFSNPIIFAGSIPKCQGFMPNYDRGLNASTPALLACKENGVDEVILTLWGVDGDEAFVDSTNLGALLYGEHCHHEIVDEEWLQRRCQFLTGLDVEDFTVLGDFDKIPGVQVPNIEEANPHKPLFYQDILLGTVDNYVMDLDLASHYGPLVEKFAKLATKTTYYKKMYEMYSGLAKVLETKANIGSNLRKAYKANDREALARVGDTVIPKLSRDLEAFIEIYRSLWLYDCKAQGYELMDLRMAGILGRLRTAAYRIEEYLSGEITQIEELEEELLPFRLGWHDTSHFMREAYYTHIATQAAYKYNIE